MRFLSLQSVLVNGSMAGNLVSAVVAIPLLSHLAVQVTVAGAGGTGELLLQGSNDGVNFGEIRVVGREIIAGNGVFIRNMPDIGARWVRFQYLRTTGTGTLNLLLSAKGG